MSLRVAFFGNSDSVFSNRHFRALLRTRCPLVAVVDVPPLMRTSTNAGPARGAASFVEHARRHAIPLFEPANPNAPEFIRALRATAPDLLLAVGYTRLLKPELLAVPRLLAVNFHASLLPAYRGKHPVFWALRHGEPWIGLTVHIMDPQLDTGDMLYQVRVRARRHDTVTTAYDRIMARSVPLVARLLADTAAGRLVRTVQPTAGASYYSSIREQDFALDLTCDAETLRRWIQTSPAQCFVTLPGRRVFLSDAESVPNPAGLPPGFIAKIGRTTVTLATGRDALRVGRARVDDGPEQVAAAVFRSLELALGAQLALSPAPDTLARSEA